MENNILLGIYIAIKRHVHVVYTSTTFAYSVMFFDSGVDELGIAYILGLTYTL